jgi:hypothetical protein
LKGKERKKEGRTKRKRKGMEGKRKRKYFSKKKEGYSDRVRIERPDMSTKTASQQSDQRRKVGCVES